MGVQLFMPPRHQAARPKSTIYGVRQFQTDGPHVHIVHTSANWSTPARRTPRGYAGHATANPWSTWSTRPRRPCDCRLMVHMVHMVHAAPGRRPLSFLTIRLLSVGPPGRNGRWLFCGGGGVGPTAGRSRQRRGYKQFIFC